MGWVRMGEKKGAHSLQKLHTFLLKMHPCLILLCSKYCINGTNKQEQMDECVPFLSPPTSRWSTINCSCTQEKNDPSLPQKSIGLPLIVKILLHKYDQHMKDYSEHSHLVHLNLFQLQG